MMLNESQTELATLCEEHIRDKFVTKNTEDTLQTMVADAYVNHVPVLTGSVVRRHSERFTVLILFRKCRQIRK